MFVYTNKRCVYGHYVNNELIYIGAGTLFRAFSYYPRRALWKELVADGYDVIILAWYPDLKSAQDLEKKLIKQHKPKCNLAHNGYSNAWGNKWNIGRRHTEKAKKILSEKLKASWRNGERKAGSVKPRMPIKCIETGIIYDGLREAARQTGFCPSHLSNCINGVIPHAGGYHFTREI